MKRSQRVARGAATQVQRDHLTSLHIEVYGYITAETVREIEGMSWLRVAQDTANLTRAKADKDALMRARSELRELHRALFGVSVDRDVAKLTDIDGYDARRVQSELLTLRRMHARKTADQLERIDRYNREKGNRLAQEREARVKQAAWEQVISAVTASSAALSGGSDD